MLEIANCEILRIEDVMVGEHTSVFAGWNDEVRAANEAWLAPTYLDTAADAFKTSIHSWIVRTDRHTIVIDTGSGDQKPRPASPRFGMLTTGFDQRLAAAGIDRHAVDMVILTHLHIDHVGWNTVLRGEEWVPFFPNALHVMSETEVAQRDPERGAASRPPASWHPFLDSVAPILRAGLARQVRGDEEVLPGMRLVPIPGHAPGQFGVAIGSGRDQAFFTADVLHQPIQVLHPEWNSKYCEDGAMAATTRAKVLDHAASTGCLILPAHFAGNHCGHIEKGSGGYRFVPSETSPNPVQ